MSLIGESIALSSAFLYTAQVPRGLESDLVVLGIYAIHLLISTVILYASIKMVGGGTNLVNDLPKSLFTIFIRDLIAIPLMFMTFFIPFFGVVIALIVWIALIKYIFNIPWVKTFLAFIVSLILPVVILLFILIPISLIFL